MISKLVLARIQPVGHIDLGENYSMYKKKQKL